MLLIGERVPGSMLDLGSVSCSVVVGWVCAARRRAGAGPRPARACRPGCRAGSWPGRPAPEPAVRSTRQRPFGRAVRPRGRRFGRAGRGALLEEPVKEPTRYQLLSDAQSWDDGLESNVTWRGTDKVQATSLALRPVYARCLPEDALTTGGIAVTGSACQAQARRTASGAEPCEPRSGASPARPRRDTAGGVARAAPGLLRCGLPPPRRGLLEEQRDRRVNRQPATGGAGCRLDDAPARRGAGAPTRLVQYERTARVFTTPRTPGPRPTAREGWADARDPAALS